MIALETNQNLTFRVLGILLISTLLFFLYRTRTIKRVFLWGLFICFLPVFIYGSLVKSWYAVSHYSLFVLVPSLLVNTLLFAFFYKETKQAIDPKKRYTVFLKTKWGKLKIKNIKRGASIIGAAGSGKTESVIYNFLQHFSKYSFCGIIHDYKDFELTEIANPLFKDSGVDFYPISFDAINYSYKANPIAPHYLESEEAVNEISKVLLDNLLEKKESGFSQGSAKFFDDAVEGLISGLIWKLKTDFPQFCTLPHLITLYTSADANTLIDFLSSNAIAKMMANAFIKGKESEKQTAGILASLSNAFKKIATRKIFMVLSDDEVPLNINSAKNKAVVSLINNPKYETAYSPIIATLMHTIVKQMSVRNQEPSFLMIEEAPTIRLLNMHRIPATLRSYDISTIYVMQDKVQNDLLYGDKASKAILSNLSYQFFGKANDPDTANYYERFFEIVKVKTKSINESYTLKFDTRITTGEKDVSKIRAFEFFKLKQGEFITFSDGQEKKVQFKLQQIEKKMPEPIAQYTEKELQKNYDKIVREALSILNNVC